MDSCSRIRLAESSGASTVSAFVLAAGCRMGTVGWLIRHSRHAASPWLGPVSVTPRSSKATALTSLRMDCFVREDSPLEELGRADWKFARPVYPGLLQFSDR